MLKELKIAIIEWLLQNENQWQRVNSCVEMFRNYIYDSEGNFLIGGETIHDFIVSADNLIYQGSTKQV